MEINVLVQQAYNTAKSKGFWDNERNVGEMLMLVVSELGEAIEAHRKGKYQDVVDYNEAMSDLDHTVGLDNEEDRLYAEKRLFESYLKDTFEDEIADAIIRLFDMCGGMGIDIENAMLRKMAYNKTRERLNGKEY